MGSALIIKYWSVERLPARLLAHPFVHFITSTLGSVDAVKVGIGDHLA